MNLIMYGHKSAPPCTDVGGAYGGRWASDGVRATTINHVHAHLVGVCMGSVHYAQCYRTE